MASPLRVLVVGCGNMGASHARAYHRMPEFQIVGLVSRGPESRGRLSAELGGLPEFSDFHQALAATVVGSAGEITGPEKEAVLQRYLQKHPYLEDFARSPTSALVKVSARAYILVKNFQNVMELHLDP